MKPTLKTVAQYTGVSLATASLALNNKSVVRKETREKVLMAAQELGYHPSTLARGLRLQRTNIIGFLVCYPNLELLQAINSAAQERGFHVITQTFSAYNINEEASALGKLVSRHIDGLVMWPTEYGLDYSKHIEEFRRRNIPVVLVDRTLRNINVPSFHCDNRKGAEMAWIHLHKLGRDPIIYLDMEEDFDSILARREGITEAHFKCQARIRPENHIKVLKKNKVNQGAIKEAIERAKKGGAIFCTADHIAFSVIRQARSMNISIPDDFALVGFEDVMIWLDERVGWSTCPPLSTIRMNFHNIGIEATNYLLDKIEKKN